MLDKPDPIAVSPNDAARFAGVSRWTINDLLRQGKLSAKKQGRRTLIDYGSLKAYVANLPDATFANPRSRSSSKEAA